MDYWADSPLNKAHFYERKANSCAQRLLYDEAIECHSSACVELDKSLKYTTNIKARESIKLQYEYHKKQKDFLKLKKLQCQIYKETLKVQREAILRIMRACGVRENELENDGKEATLKMAIFRNIEEADCLTELLVQMDEKGKLKQNDTSEIQLVKVSCGNKRPKDETTVIEELKILNYQLRSLISELMSQLVSKENEAEILGKRVVQLEAENARLRGESGDAFTYSPSFAFSPSDEIFATPASELPTLAPLELPSFDLTVLHRKETESCNS